jgi:hypothetical protein
VVGLHAGDDLAADLPHRRVVVTEQAGFHFFLAGRIAVAAHPDQRHLAADVLAQQLFGLEQVVFVVLLEDVDARRLGERSKVNGGRVDGGSDVHEVEIGRAAGHLNIADIANQRQVGVVNGDGELRLIVERRRHWRRRLRGGGRRRRFGMERRGDSDGENDRRKPESCRHERPPVLRTERRDFLAARGKRLMRKDLSEPALGGLGLATRD